MLWKWLIVYALSALVSLPGLAQWEGTWDTVWNGGGARMVLQHEQDRVFGIYEPYGGIIEAQIRGNQLHGQWLQQEEQGSFIFTLAPNKETFMGRYDNGEWWNGERIVLTQEVQFKAADLSSPRSTMRSFLIAFNQLAYRQYAYSEMALQTIDFSAVNADSPKRKIQLAESFFRVIDQMTLRIWELPATVEGNQFKTTLRQYGTDRQLNLSFSQTAEKEWRLIALEADVLDQKYKDFLLAINKKVDLDDAHLQLKSPRDTMHAFIEQIHQWNKGGQQHVLRTLDLSQISQSIRDSEAAIRAEYLKHIIDRVGYVIWQEIPNDPESEVPYVFFEHTLGDIVIAPKIIDDQKVWQFTSQTMANLKELHDAFEAMPLAKGLSADSQMQWFFQMRQSIRHMPLALKPIFGMELWQLIAGLLAAVLGYVVAMLLAKLCVVSIRFLRRLWGFMPGAGKLDTFYQPLKLTFLFVIWGYVFDHFGLPDGLHVFLNVATNFGAVIGFFWTAIRLTDWVGGYFRAQVEGQHTHFDDIFVSLVSGIIKLVLIAAAIILIAETLGLPFGSVLAGLGIGGLAIAFAARETIADFFGSAVLLTDRPFRRGDLVCIGEVTGHIHHVGLRSTQVRTLDDSIMTIPNSQLAHQQIENLKLRQDRHFRTMIGVTYDTPVEKLEEFAGRIKQTILDSPFGLPRELHCAVWEFADSSINIQLFCYLKAKNRQQEFVARNAVMQAIIALADQMGVEFAFPTTTIHVPDAVKLAQENLTHER